MTTTPSERDRLVAAVDSLRRALPDLQYLQESYDTVGWRVSDPPWRKTRHVLLHLSAVSAEIAAVIERLEHAEEDGVAAEELDALFRDAMTRPSRLAADLVMHGLQLATIVERGIDELMIERYRSNAARFAPGTTFAEVIDETCGSSADP